MSEVYTYKPHVTQYLYTIPVHNTCIQYLYTIPVIASMNTYISSCSADNMPF